MTAAMPVRPQHHQEAPLSARLTGHVKPKFILTGLVNEPSGNVSGIWKELDPRTGVTVLPYVHGGSGLALGW